MKLTERSALASIGAIALALGAAHLLIDGLGSSVITLQAVIRDQTSAGPAVLSVLIAVALSSSSLLQPLGARAAFKVGDGRVALLGSVLAAVGYGLLPFATHPGHAVAAVVVGGLGYALFHPAAGALAARSASNGQESLSLAVFSAIGMAGSALVPVAVLGGVHVLGGAAAVPFAAPLLVLTAALLLSRTMRSKPPGVRPVDKPLRRRGRSSTTVAPVLAATMLSFVGITVMASAPLLLADRVTSTDPLLGYSLAAYGTAAAVGGILLALLARHTTLRPVMLCAAAAGISASLAVPHLPPAAIPAAMAVAGVGLSGTLPLLVTVARRSDEASAGPAVARILGLAPGFGSAGYAAVGLLHSSLGYGTALTLTSATAGAAALIVLMGVRGPASKASARTALSACLCSACACGNLNNQPTINATPLCHRDLTYEVKTLEEQARIAACTVPPEGIR